jgi:hypothetical protein
MKDILFSLLFQTLHVVLTLNHFFADVQLMLLAGKLLLQFFLSSLHTKDASLPP